MSTRPSKLKTQSFSRPPLSTTTSSSKCQPASSTSSDSMSPLSSPTTTAPLSPATRTNPLAIFHGRNPSRSSTGDSFFRSRSHSRSKSPSHLPGTTLEPSQTSPITSAHPAAPKNRRTFSESSVSPTEQAKRNSMSKKPRSPPDSTTHYGRHSNAWLFNNFSVTETVKNLLHNEDEDHRKSR